MSWSQRSLSALYAIGLALFALSCVAGVVYALTQERAVPAVRLGYVPHVDRLLAEGRLEEALDQMYRASLIEINGGTARKMVQVAAALGDVERARFAARTWASLDAMDPGAHAAACSSLLTGLDTKGIDAQELALVEEAMDHAKALIVLMPERATGHRCLGIALVLRGTHSGAPIDFITGGQRLARALEIDPGLDDVRRWLRYAKSRDQQ